jgi:hypothetical protein
VTNDIDHDRRRFLGTAAMTIAAARVGTFATADAAPREARELAAFGRANEWLNSPRLTPESLAGKIVLVGHPPGRLTGSMRTRAATVRSSNSACTN